MNMLKSIQKAVLQEDMPMTVKGAEVADDKMLKIAYDY